MSLISFSLGACEKSGPVGVIAKAIEKAMSMPPQAINGMANDTPVRRCCRSCLRNSTMGSIVYNEIQVPAYFIDIAGSGPTMKFLAACKPPRLVGRRLVPSGVRASILGGSMYFAYW